MPVVLLVAMSVVPMVTFIAVPVAITVAVVTTIVTMAIVVSGTIPVIVIVIIAIQAQSQQDPAEKTQWIPIVVMGLGCRADEQGCGEKSRYDERLAFHGKPPFFKLQV
jgi:hypothetical protein